MINKKIIFYVRYSNSLRLSGYTKLINMKNQILKSAGKLFLATLVIASLSFSTFASVGGPFQEKDKMSKMKSDKMGKKKMDKMSKMKTDSMKKAKMEKSKMANDKMSKGKM